jgi:anti-sigma factor RsiW
MNCEEVQELLEAFHDGELVAGTREEVAVHVKGCPACAAALARLESLSAAVKGVGSFELPASLRAAVNRTVAENRRGLSRANRRRMFGALAASHIAVAVLGGALAYGLIRQYDTRDFNAQELVSAHVRSLMDDKLVQVVSSDMHTVRPWFAGKVDFAPDVRNFDPKNFPLLGGRVDYVGGAGVAALVYGHNKHVINVFVSMAPAHAAQTGAAYAKNGYNIVEWQMQDLRYRAISDMSADELADFARRFQAAPAS